MSEFFNVLRLEEARRLIERHWPAAGTETVGLEQALDRRLAVPVVAGEDLPAFPRSTVDGYAVRARDVFGASESIPAFLTYVGEIFMGEAAGLELHEGECAWIPTGGALPDGADAVVMVEYTERLGDDTVLITRPVSPGDNVIRVGEDCRKGETAIPAGRVLRPQEIGVAAALGYTHLQVEKALRVGIISTGDEVIDISSSPGPGQVRDINSHTLRAAVKRRGGEPRLYGIVPDDYERLRETLTAALAENDLVLMSGGSSVGTRDLSLKVMMSLPGARSLFHGIAVKPGKPTLAVQIDDKLVIGLPGHPVSALMVFEMTVGRLLQPEGHSSVQAVLHDNIASQAGRDDLVRVELRDGGSRLWAVPVHGKAGLIRVMSQADGYIHVPYEKQGLARGEQVTVHLF